MKKYLSFILIIVLAFSFISCVTTSSNSKAVPKIGTVINGFRLVKISKADFLNANLLQFEHEKTGAQLLFIQNDDTNRAFSVAFQTPCPNDKGLAHVFEHSTLSGSEKYPDSSLFFSMMDQTYNTFLNAFTYRAMTMFPAASLSEDQLLKFVDYDLAGVFYPLILNDEKPMMREAYRYELDNKDGDIKLTGTVYNEMQGAYSLDRASSLFTLKECFPGSFYANESGGYPTKIQDMTHEELINFHNKYYHPSNSLITLYGDLDYKKFLGFIDTEYLSKFEKEEINVVDENYKPQSGYKEVVVSYPVAKDASKTPIIDYAFVLDNISKEDFFALKAFSSVFNKEGSPLAKAILEKMPYAKLTVSVDDSYTEPLVIFSIKGANESDKTLFKQIVDESIATLIKEGTNKEYLSSIAKTSKFSTLLTRENSSCGTNVIRNTSYYWQLSGKDPFEFFKQQEQADNLGNYVDSFDSILKNTFDNIKCSRLVIVKPDLGGLEKQNAEIAQSLKNKKAKMSAEEIDALVAKTKEFATWTEENAKTSMINEMQEVTVKTLPEKLVKFEAKKELLNGISYISSEVGCNGVIANGIYIDSSVIPFEYLHEYNLYASLLGKLDTEKYSVSELQEKCISLLNNFSINATASSSDDGTYKKIFVISWQCLKEDVEEALDLVKEILLHTDFSDIKRIRKTITDSKQSIQSSTSYEPASIALTTAFSMVIDANLYVDELSGYKYYNFLKEISKYDDANLAMIVDNIKNVSGLLMNRNLITYACVSNKESLKEVKSRLASFAESFEEFEPSYNDYSDSLVPYKDSVAIIVNGNMQYNTQIAAQNKTEATYDARLLPMNQALGSYILVPELRYKGAAYGAWGDFQTKYAYAFSYRDPNLKSTYELYSHIGDIMKSLSENASFTQEVLDGCIKNSYTSFAMPVGPISGGMSAVSSLFLGNENPYDKKTRYMKQMKSFTVEDIAEVLPVFYELQNSKKRVTVGGFAAINENKEMFDTIITDYMTE